MLFQLFDHPWPPFPFVSVMILRYSLYAVKGELDMSVSPGRTIRVGLALVLVGSTLSVAAQTATARIVTAANTFLSKLDEKQRQSVLFALTMRSSVRAGPIFLCRWWPEPG